MKLLFVFHDRANYTGGPAINMVRLLPELAKRGHEVAALCIWSGQEEAHPNGDKLTELGVPCRFHSYTYYSEPLVKWILEQVADIKPDVFVPNISTQGCFAGRWVKAAGIPVIDTHRSHDGGLNTGKAQFFATGPLKWRVSGMVFVNKFLRSNLFKGKDDLFPSAVIPSGVPIPENCADQDVASFKIVYAGRLEEKQKRVSDMLRAFFKICEKYSYLEISLIGSTSPDRLNFYQSLVKGANLERQIAFKGRLIGEEYKKELLKHQVIVLLSDYEGTPGSIMDGMSCGLVPVCLDIPGIHDLVRHEETGLLVKNREDSFFQAIEVLINNVSLRKNLATNARALIESEYSIEYAAKKWEEFALELRKNSHPKKTIKIPRKLRLPTNTPLLLEHRRMPTLMERIVSKVKRIPNIVPLLHQHKKASRLAKEPR